MDVGITGLLIIIILGLCEAIKTAGVPTQFIPVIAIILGMVGAVITGGTSWLQLASGVIAGLSSSGLYSGVIKTNIVNQ